ncbi:hypothetical protein KUM42_07795 [Modestobacter sp. L9-4]|uniref:hypothetical protein n=1 Tax=Modestobacter sp. L9-4 TaxID=2851567 RepID=UPI001C764CE9|nr:hypothetical protein [Modestobacter sp. L9-4]QXG77397.1 hypothetical protein KUM42_07795 [Modestobacter sp. L9-4]
MDIPPADPIPAWFTPFAEQVYLRELLQQAEYLQVAYLNLVEVFNDRELDSRVNMAFSQALAMVGAAASMSKILWPPTRNVDSRARGHAIRTRLGIDETSLLHDRAVRNDFEHFDERLDEFFQSGRTNIFDRALTPVEMLPLGPYFDPPPGSSGDGGAIFRLIDPVAGTIAVLGHSIGIDELHAASGDVYRAAVKRFEEIDRTLRS